MLFLDALICFLLGISIVDSAPLSVIQTDPLLQVTTTSGNFTGLYNSESQVYRYLGIPYGETTAGNNRFLPPLSVSAPPTTTTTTPQDATQYGQTCPQYLSSASQSASKLTGQFSIDNQGEDCLNLNVWVGKNTRQQAGNSNGTGAPIMLWFYGGSFTWGSTQYTNGENITTNYDDVIVISVSYRVNIFGFPRSPQLQNNTQGINLGLLDRDLAIDWVKQNAANFGGDGNRIILWGQSAGGSAIDSWAFSHSGQDGLPSSNETGVVGLIVESGAVQGLDAFIQGMDSVAPSSSQSSWNQAANAAGCGIAGDGDQLACMRSKSYQDLISAIGTLTFAPTPDNKTWFNDFSNRAETGKFARIPLLIGSNTDEGTVLLLAANTTALSEVGDIFITPLVFQCPAKRAATERSQFGVPTYRYLYGGNWDDINSGRPQLKAYHGSEVPVMWGFYNATPLAVAVSEGQREMGIRMLTYTLLSTD